MHKDYKIIEVNYARRYDRYDLFIVANNARQVYYLSYPGRDRNNWRVVVKCKPRGMIEYHNEQTQDEPFQYHEETPARIVTDTTMPQALASPAGTMTRDGGSGQGSSGMGRGSSGRGRGRPKKNTGVRLDLGSGSHPSTSAPTTTTTDTATTSPPFVATARLSAGLLQMVMIPTPGLRVQSSDTAGAPHAQQSPSVPVPPQTSSQPSSKPSSQPQSTTPVTGTDVAEDDIETTASATADPHPLLVWDGHDCRDDVRAGTKEITNIFMEHYKWYAPQFSQAPDEAIEFWWKD
ncbi:hypothetical protein PIB30_064190 [Stylosanthes scabra]|uniref:DUF4216 domain-containing protein n=1 Tax=Stylosanthes scabra TaxID=79078 RepID=A0ABU6WQW2_9FABA|nr:hypothetical protein [Stylosanthes scabra]